LAARGLIENLWKKRPRTFNLAPQMPYHAEFEQWIPAPLEKVFEFFGDPMNLPRIMPAWMRVRIEEITIVASRGFSSARFAGEGTRFLASYRALPFLPMRIRSEVQIVGFGLNEFFADVQSEGPFRSWHHRHEFAAENRNGISGTRLRDRIEYEIGYGPIGSMVNALFIAPQTRRTFVYRQRAVVRLLDAMT
jgi:ligand-binding SRPBCC domain-containing protein